MVCFVCKGCGADVEFDDSLMDPEDELCEDCYNNGPPVK